jgi:hypothetical protein
MIAVSFAGSVSRLRTAPTIRGEGHFSCLFFVFLRVFVSLLLSETCARAKKAQAASYLGFAPIEAVERYESIVP